MRKPHKTTKKHRLRKKSLPLWVTTEKPQNLKTIDHHQIKANPQQEIECVKLK